MTFFTLFLKVLNLQGKVASALAGNWFQLFMVLFTKEYLPTSVLCLYAGYAYIGYFIFTSSKNMFTFKYAANQLFFQVLPAKNEAFTVMWDEPLSSLKLEVCLKCQTSCHRNFHLADKILLQHWKQMIIARRKFPLIVTISTVPWPSHGSGG
jgi:hypothetical protein